MTLNRTIRIASHILLIAVLIAVASVLTYRFTHQRYLSLKQRLQQQHRQQDQLIHYQTVLDQPDKQPALNNQWRWPSLADSLGLAITVQPAVSDQQPLRLSLTGSAMAVRRFLSHESTRLAQASVPLSLSQLLTWQVQNNGQVRLNWHLQSNWVDHYLSPWSIASNLPNACISDRPVSVITLKDLSGYQFSAVITQFVADTAQSTAYFTNRQGQAFELRSGDWIQQPLSQVRAISTDGITLRRWQNRNGCWQYEDAVYQLKESL